MGGGTSVGPLTAIGGTTSPVPTANGSIGMQLQGWIFGGGTGGNVTLRWAQQTSDANNTTVKQNSFLRARKLAA